MTIRELFLAILGYGAGDKIPAIKLLRNEAGISLLEAKNIVDVLSGTHRAVREEEEYAPPPPDVVTRRLDTLEAHINVLTSAHNQVVRALKTAKIVEKTI